MDYSHSKKFLLPFLLFLFSSQLAPLLFPFSGNSATIKGWVLDLYGRPLAGAVLEIKGLGLKDSCGEQGNLMFKK
ncbi:MAG: hypothetical protein DRI99_08555, partial [Candidatus Aminicenantes bacterium]